MGYWCTEPEVKAVNSEMVEHHLQEVIFWVSGQNGIPSAAILLLRDLLVDSFWSHFHRQLPVFLFSHYLHPRSCSWLQWAAAISPFCAANQATCSRQSGWTKDADDRTQESSSSPSSVFIISFITYPRVYVSFCCLWQICVQYCPHFVVLLIFLPSPAAAAALAALGEMLRVNLESLCC